MLRLQPGKLLAGFRYLLAQPALFYIYSTRNSQVPGVPRYLPSDRAANIVPSAANVVAFSAQLNDQPEKAATPVLAGTIFTLFYIPVVVWSIGI